MNVNIGDQYLRTLPSWIDGGRRVVVTITRVLKGIETLNGHQVEGTWVDSQGGAHRGKFYLKNLTWCDSATTMRIEIQKNEHRGWNCTSIVKYPDWDHEVYTNNGYGTLKSSLWHAVLHCVDLGAELTTVNVNGRLMSFTEVWEIVHGALVGGALNYRLNDIRELLGVET